MEIEQDLDEGGYVVSFPDLPGCITCADTLEKAIELASDAKQERGLPQRSRMGSMSRFRTVWRTIPGNSNCAFPAVFTSSWRNIPNVRSA